MNVQPAGNNIKNDNEDTIGGLFDTPELIPAEIQAILDSFEDNSYEECERVQKELEARGFTFDWGLDAEPYNLRKFELKKVTIYYRDASNYKFSNIITVNAELLADKTIGEEYEVTQLGLSEDEWKDPKYRNGSPWDDEDDHTFVTLDAID